MICETSTPTVADLAAATGWTVEPQGACRGDICVPLPEGVRVGDDRVDLRAFAAALRMPLVHDAGSGLSALGPSTLSGRALVTAEAPDLVLPDLDGRPFRLASLRGRKVCLVAWSPY
ncbi:MAG: hypothetical protein FJW83_11355 [Actinobacteria bacterium]|nr:hypothetical protein [Actinomycetota bacterium]